MRGSSIQRRHNMPFIINGQKVNKPIYKGTTLNAIHVWLQNHWTGTANASTSTLSKDGSVVATNLLTDPSVETNDPGLIVYNGSSSSVPAGLITPFDGSRRVSLASMYANRFSMYSYATAPGSKYHLSFKVISWLAGDVSVYLNSDTSKPIATFSFSSPQQSWVTRDVEFTPANSNTWLIFTSNSGGIALDAFLVCTAADWTALQALGVTWFDGDSYVRGVV